MSLASADLFTLRRRQRRRLTPAETLVVFLHPLLFVESCLPAPFQLTSHKPVLRFHGLILARGTLGLVSSPLTFLPALLMQSLTLLLDIGRRGQMQFHRGRLECRQDLLANERVQALPRQTLADRLGVVDNTAGAAMAQARSGVGVSHHQAPTATATN